MSARTVETIGLLPEDRARVDRLKARLGLPGVTAVVRHALEVADAQGGPPVPRAAPNAWREDATRLASASGDMPAPEVAALAGCGATIVRKVRRGEVRLSGKLLSWVEAREAGR